LPSSIIRDCLVKFAEAKSGPIKRKRISNFRDWITHSFGEGMARYFMFPYNRKLWKVPLRDIDTDWVEKFIPKTDLAQAIRGGLSDYKRTFGYNRTFFYPKSGGIQAMVEGLFNQRKEKVVFRKKVSAIYLREKKLVLETGEGLRFDRLVSSMPLPELRNVVKDLSPAIIKRLDSLRYVSVYNLNLGVDRNICSEKHWAYFPESKYVFYRVGFSSNFSKDSAPKGKASLYIEVSYTKDRPLAYGRAELRDRVIGDLCKVGILRPQDKIIAENVCDIKYAYPLHDKKRAATVREIKDFLRSHNVCSIGRYGSWEYMTMEECVLEGKALAEELNEATTYHACREAGVVQSERPAKFEKFSRISPRNPSDFRGT